MGFLSDTLKRLTSNYQKSTSGNIGKLFSIVSLQVEEVRRTLEKIEQYRDIDLAVGASLDRIGRNVGQPRGSSTDIDYRKLIKTKIKANLSAGDIETINEVMEVLMGEAFLGARETWYLSSYDYEPAAIALRFSGLEDLIEKEYEDYVDDPIYLNGVYSLAGERLLDGGFKYDPRETLEKRIETMRQIKTVAKRITAGGVHVYWEIPELISNPIIISHQVPQRVKQSFSNPITVSQTVTNATTTAVTTLNQGRLDGIYLLDGSTLLDGRKEFIVHQVEIREVTA
ncbi:hypothetical protein [Brevibacillus centrosporus]|uniref:hypothetical protein n=1 Tax=Brevibacillus centrosporus TaxID=54910 RepID=UPI003985981C